MMYQVYAVLDKQAKLFVNPFVARHEAEAVRSIKRVANDPQTTLHRHASDFALYLMVSFNDESGEIEVKNLPAKVIEVSSLVEVPTNG